MSDNKGWTIIQRMIALLIAGAIGALAVDALIGKRCEDDPSRWICAGR